MSQEQFGGWTNGFIVGRWVSLITVIRHKLYLLSSNGDDLDDEETGACTKVDGNYLMKN